MKLFLTSLLLIFSFNSYALTVTGFNLQWFGNGGELQGDASDEYRSVRIKDFIDKNLKDTDVFVFSEVTNVEMLREMMTDYSCHSYYEQSTKLQHLVICADKKFSIAAHTIKEVTLGIPGMRPALVAKITNQQGYSFNVVGVHLKAKTHNTERRLEQLSILLAAEEFTLPTIVIGDFNTYPSKKNQKELDDDVYMSELFAPHGFSQVGGAPEIYTYLGTWSKSTLDRAWIKNLTAVQSRVVGPCNRENDTQGPYERISFYKRFVSDHCALSVELQ